MAEASRPLGFDPHVVFDGPIDTAVDDRVGQHLLAVLREALSNVARHAHASRVHIAITVGSEVLLRVTDDGLGVAAGTLSGKGLGNMTSRAKSLGGECRVEPGPAGGTVVRWRVPAKLSN